MSYFRFTFGILLIACLWSCSRLPGSLAPAPTSTPQSAPDPVDTPVVQADPPTPIMLSDEDIGEQCFYMDTDVPNALLEPLDKIVYTHTTRPIQTGEGRFRIERGYFVDPSQGAVDDSHKPVPTPEIWDPGSGNHAFIHHGHLHGYLGDTTFQITPNRVVPRRDHWELTLYGAMNVELRHGGGIWELRANATLDPETCEAILERVVAGPDEIVLYPEDES